MPIIAEYLEPTLLVLIERRWAFPSSPRHFVSLAAPCAAIAVSSCASFARDVLDILGIWLFKGRLRQLASGCVYLSLGLTFKLKSALHGAYTRPDTMHVPNHRSFWHAPAAQLLMVLCEEATYLNMEIHCKIQKMTCSNLSLECSLSIACATHGCKYQSTHQHVDQCPDCLMRAHANAGPSTWYGTLKWATFRTSARSVAWCSSRHNKLFRRSEVIMLAIAVGHPAFSAPLFRLQPLKPLCMVRTLGESRSDR